VLSARAAAINRRIILAKLKRCSRFSVELEVAKLAAARRLAGKVKVLLIKQHLTKALG
jgi:hypothetical protein